MCDHGRGCSHEHSHEDELELGIQYSLYQKINLDQVICFNEQIEGSGKLVFKPYERRFDKTEFVVSDCDEELLINVPFTGNVKLKAVKIIGGDGTSHPKSMRLFKNRPTMTLEDVNCEPDQQFELVADETGNIEYPAKAVKFSNLYHLSIHFPDNFGSDSTTVYYIGLRGEFTSVNRDQVAIATYEARAVPEDHKGELPDNVRYDLT